jgi:2-hydroxy-3-keto-5-methylthiopentenyl-1-phosphate phosphatase
MDSRTIISDFDGTISLQDVNDMVFELFGDKRSIEIEEKLLQNEIDYRTALKSHYEHIKMTEEQFYRFIDKSIRLDPRVFLHVVDRYVTESHVLE